MLADWPGDPPAVLFEARDLRPTLQLDAFIGGAVVGHFGVEPAKAMAALFPASKGTAAVAGLV